MQGCCYVGAVHADEGVQSRLLWEPQVLSEVLFCQPDEPSLGLAVTLDTDQLFWFNFSGSSWVRSVPELPPEPPELEAPELVLKDAEFCKRLLVVLTNNVVSGQQAQARGYGGIVVVVGTVVVTVVIGYCGHGGHCGRGGHRGHYGWVIVVMVGTVVVVVIVVAMVIVVMVGTVVVVVIVVAMVNVVTVVMVVIMVVTVMVTIVFTVVIIAMVAITVIVVMMGQHGHHGHGGHCGYGGSTWSSWPWWSLCGPQGDRFHPRCFLGLILGCKRANLGHFTGRVWRRGTLRPPQSSPPTQAPLCPHPIAGIPVAKLFPLQPPALGQPNTLVCLVENISPPAVDITWRVDDVPVTHGVTHTGYTATNGVTFTRFSYLQVTPSAGTAYSCVVTKPRPNSSAVAYWVAQETADTETLWTALCGAAMALGTVPGSDGHRHGGWWRGGAGKEGDGGHLVPLTTTPYWCWCRLSPFSIKPLLSMAALAALMVASPMADMGLSYTYTPPSKTRFLGTVPQFPRRGMRPQWWLLQWLIEGFNPHGVTSSVPTSPGCRDAAPTSFRGGPGLSVGV
ncbi:LOW QUALITY PROTEIN: uncharacterized protein LOC136007038 [Lathamus discolor]|uniref:LOW QUALITY PROTEIN: uncharacterized protein LOC136007038 n=1 Tax=Lathamus discolor TaxID=678569 RepID=UPI0032B7569F